MVTQSSQQCDAMPPTSSSLRLVRHLIRPARGGAAGVVIVFAFLLFIASKAGLAGLPLGLILTSWFFKYAYILLDHSARGMDEPPTLDMEMVNPFNEQRPLGQVLILVLIYFLVNWTQTHLGTPASVSLAAVLLFFLPASAGILGLESHLLKAANPLAWIHMIRGLGSLYALLLLIIAGYAGTVWLLWRVDLWMPLETVLEMFSILSVFSFLGGAIYERRHELGIDTWVSPERTEEREKKQEMRQSETVVMEAYGLMRVGSHVKSWQVLVDWLAGRGSTPEDYAWLSSRVAGWDDPRYITRLSEDRVARLLTLKRSGEALDVVSERLMVDPKFRPRAAADTFAIAEMAARGGGKLKVARALLSDFTARFPADAHAAAAVTLARQWGSGAP
jgi:hypothetical protein